MSMPYKKKGASLLIKYPLNKAAAIVIQNIHLQIANKIFSLLINYASLRFNYPYISILK